IKLGHAQDMKGRTGVTVVLCDRGGAVGGVDVRGAAPGTRETDLLRSGNLVERVDAIVLAGGSAFGLDSASGVMKVLEQAGVGHHTVAGRIPIVPAAVLYDLGVGNPKARPDAKMGGQACVNASKEATQGRVGAGTGASVCKLVPNTTFQQGGLGTASITLANGITVGAVAAVNAVGDIYHPYNGELVAAAVGENGKPMPVSDLLFGSPPAPEMKRISQPGQNTTIGVIATDAWLTKEQANRLATVAHNGFARTIRPVHTPMDGDTIFALGTGRVEQEVNMIQLCLAATEAMAMAVYNGVIAGNRG
ncbi:MAG: P1 family peptidase, partial [Clostridiales bacterium]|nr:P1 family peptidase [Clostridiales bacterium]